VRRPPWLRLRRAPNPAWLALGLFAALAFHAVWPLIVAVGAAEDQHPWLHGVVMGACLAPSLWNLARAHGELRRLKRVLAGHGCPGCLRLFAGLPKLDFCAGCGLWRLDALEAQADAAAVPAKDRGFHGQR
jgi:hypothetical protein